jgi:hypothetical protein
MTETTPPIICESCGCEVYAAGHPGDMCRTIRALRAELEQQERYIEKAHRLRSAATVERDALAAALARVMPVVEAAIDEYTDPDWATDDPEWMAVLEREMPKSIATMRAVDALTSTSSDTKGNA